MASDFLALLNRERKRVAAPVLIVGGAPRLAVDLVRRLELPGTACYQMDLYQANRLREELAAAGAPPTIPFDPPPLAPDAAPVLFDPPPPPAPTPPHVVAAATATVVTAADLWDLPGRYATLLLPSPPRGERELKRDFVEQGFHLLDPGGKMVVLSPIPKDEFYPALMKKVFGKVALSTDNDDGTVLWSSKTGDHPRRRHELAVHARLSDTMALDFITRPGVFAYGRLDDGARALADVMDIQPGDRVLELGSGSGAVGIAAARRAGPNGAAVLVDSNLRAVALAQLNAEKAGVANVTVVAAAGMEGVEGPFDVALANPPYYAQAGIARLFVEQSARLLKPKGRLYLVTKQWDIVEPIVAEQFHDPDMIDHRGYIVIAARKRTPRP